MSGRVYSLLRILYLKLRYGKRLKIGKGFRIRRGTTLSVRKGGRLIIGDNVFLNRGCSIVCHMNITIGNNNILGERVSIYDHDHVFNLYKNTFNGFTYGKIKIGDNNWFGTNCVILKNTTIGNRNVFGASLVIKGNYSQDGCLFKNNNNFSCDKIIFRDYDNVPNE